MLFLALIVLLLGGAGLIWCLGEGANRGPDGAIGLGIAGALWAAAMVVTANRLISAAI